MNIFPDCTICIKYAPIQGNGLLIIFIITYYYYTYTIFVVYLFALFNCDVYTFWFTISFFFVSMAAY